MTTLKQKIQSMKGSEIVKAMIDGLKNHEKRGLKIQMDFFANKYEGICFGCAATCCILEITDLNVYNLDIEEFSPITSFNEFIFDSYVFTSEKEDMEFISLFELSIDDLRRGNIRGYNKFAKEIGISILSDFYLPTLNSDDFQEKLYEYEDYCNFLVKLENQTL